MKRVFVLYTLLSCLSIPNRSKAQFSLGVEGGYSLNFLITDMSNQYLTKSESASGYIIGTQLKYTISKRFHLVATVDYVKKNYAIKRTGIYSGLYENHTNNYAQLSSYCQFNIFTDNRIDLFFSLGIFSSYWASGRIKGASANILNIYDSFPGNGQISEFFYVENYSEKMRFNKIKDNRFEIGFITGLGVAYNKSKKYSIFSEIKLYRSFSDLQKKYMINQIPKYNLTNTITIGCMRKI